MICPFNIIIILSLQQLTFKIGYVFYSRSLKSRPIALLYTLNRLLAQRASRMEKSMSCWRGGYCTMTTEGLDKALPLVSATFLLTRYQDNKPVETTVHLTFESTPKPKTSWSFPTVPSFSRSLFLNHPPFILFDAAEGNLLVITRACTMVLSV